MRGLFRHGHRDPGGTDRGSPRREAAASRGGQEVTWPTRQPSCLQCSIWSAGFTPHRKISYAGGAPTGVASEAEYLALALTSRQAAAQVREHLNETLSD